MSQVFGHFLTRILIVFFAILWTPSVVFAVASADGKTLYDDNKCASCHGPNADGKDKDGKNKDSVAKMCSVDISKLNLGKAETLKKSDAELAKIIRDGFKDSKMKGYSDKMSGDEISAVVKHIRSLRK